MGVPSSSVWGSTGSGNAEEVLGVEGSQRSSSLWSGEKDRVWLGTKHTQNRREEGGLHTVERTVLLKGVARHSKDPLFPNAAVSGREMEGWDFHNAFIGDGAREFNCVTVIVTHSSLPHSQAGVSWQMRKYQKYEE